MKARVVISSNTVWSIVNFRKGLIKALQQAGYEVWALAPSDGYEEQLATLGVRHVPIAIDNHGTSVRRDLILIGHYYLALRGLQPDIYLGYTVKPNIYGSIAAHLLKIPVINNIAGLGTAFIQETSLTRVVMGLYRFALRRSKRIFFQNNDDRELFVTRRIVARDRTGLLPGSGVDLTRFALVPPSHSDGVFQFILVARLLWDKGVGEYVEAARRVKRHFPHAQFSLLGFLDVPNRTAVSRQIVEDWAREGVIKYLGSSDDVRPFLAASDCVVLPSYREGLPKVLLEGGAMGKPLIATDVPGCRDVVEDGVNGFLCAVKDPESLAEASMKMIRLSPKARSIMGAAARAKVEKQFDERIPVAAYEEAIEQILTGRSKQ